MEKRQIMDNASDDGDNICPLCMEEMDLTDRQLKPCHCGYEICVWCWHHIMEMAEDNSKGRCPACRTPYDKERIVAATVSCDRLSEFSNEKKQKPSKAKAKAVEGRKKLCNVRVIQRNLVYVVGIPASLADEEIMEQRDFFGQYGKILKISVSKPTAYSSQHSISEPTASVYVTYMKEEDALRCIQAVDGYSLGGRALKACFGTTKYCNSWLKNAQCNNPDCLYLHDEGTRDDRFTKEEMLAKFGSKSQHFHNLVHPAQRHGGIGLPPPLVDVPSVSAISSATITGSLTKPLFDNGSVGKHIGLPAAASWGYRGHCSARSTARASFAKARSGSVPLHQVAPTLSSHTTSGAVLLSGMNGSATAVAAASSTSSSEPSCPSTGLSIHATLANCHSQPVMFIGAENVSNDSQNANSGIAEVADSNSVSAYLCGSTPANVLKSLPTECQSIISTAALKTQAGIGKRCNRSATVVDRFGVHDRSPGVTFSHRSRREFGQGDALCDGKTKDADCVKGKSPNIFNFKSSEPMYVRKLPIAADDWSQSAMHTVDKATDAHSGFHDSCTGVSSLNSVDKSGESYHTTSMLSEDISASELAMVDSFQALSLVHGGQLGRCGELLIPASSSSSSSLSDTSVAFSSGIHGHLCDELDKDLLNTPTDSLQSSSFSLNVSDLNTVSSSHQYVSDGSSKAGIHFDKFLRDPWLQGSMPDSSPRSSGNNKAQRPYLAPVANGAEQNSSVEKKAGSLLGDQHFGMGFASGISDAFERKLMEGTGENQMVSDMLSMGYDIWADGSPHDIVNFLFARKNLESISGPKDLIDWKVHSSKQSRFHFARKQDLEEESSLFCQRSYLQNDCSMPMPISEYAHTKQIPVKNCSVKLQESSSGSSPGLSASDGSQYARCKERPSGPGSDSSVTSTPICTRSSLIIPPGFGPPTRVSSVSSLGFRPHSGVEIPFELKTFEVASQFSENTSSVSTSSINPPLQTVSNSSDIEFIDPAIMAVGRGKVPTSFDDMSSGDGGSSVYDFFSRGSSKSIPLIPPVKHHLRPVDANSSSLVQQGKFFGDVTSLAHKHSFGMSNQDVDIHLLSLLPYLSEYVSATSLMGQYQGHLNCSLSIQQSACVNPEPWLQQSVGQFQESWSQGLGQAMDSSTANHKLVADVGRQTSDIQQSHERVFQSHLEDMLSNKANFNVLK